MAEEFCIHCDHARRSHAIDGCSDGDMINGRFLPCLCRIKFSEKDKFTAKSK